MVIDTCIFIEHLRAKDRTKTALYNIPDRDAIYVSAVSLYELCMGAPTEDKKLRIQRVSEGITVLPFNAEVAEKAGMIFHQLKRTNKLIDFRDIFIAATCLVFNQPILTTNKKHFARVDDLKMIV